MERRTHGHGRTPEDTGEEDATPPPHIPAFPARRNMPALLQKGYSRTCPLPHAAGHASPAETYAPRRSRPRTAGRLPVPAENTNVGFPRAPELLPVLPWKGGRMGMAQHRNIPVRKMPLPRLHTRLSRTQVHACPFAKRIFRDMSASPRSGTRLPGGDICPAQEPPPHGGTSARSGRKYKCRIPPRAGASARSAMERRTHGHGTTPEHTGEEGATPPAHIPAFPPRRDFPETRCARGKGLFPPPGIQKGAPFGAPLQCVQASALQRQRA